MWDVENTTPFPANGSFIRDHMGRSLWCLHLKASFEARFGQKPLFLSDQIPLHIGPVFDGTRLLADSDLTLPKPFCDVILTGETSPLRRSELQGRPVSVRIGDWKRTLRILPEAVRSNGKLELVANPFEPVSLDWSCAFGGEAVEDNPIGLGEADEGPLPRLVLDHAAHDSRVPVSFSPIPRSWAPRYRLGGTYDAAWQKRRAPLFPSDLDPHYWQSAPRDQWVSRDFLPETEVVLSGFRSEDLRFALPELQFEMATRFRGSWHQLEPQLQTISLDVNAMTLSMSWLATLPIGSVQSDILVSNSFIALRNHRGFAALPLDARRFTDRLYTESA